MTASTTTATAIESFEKTVGEYAAKKVGDYAEIFAQIQKVKTINPAVYDEERIKPFLASRAKALNTLVENYMVAKISSRYPLLDDKIFKLRRHLYVNQQAVLVLDVVNASRQSGVSHITVPLFAHAKADAKKVELGKLSLGWRNSQDKLTVSADVPHLPQEVAEQGHKALASYYSTMAELYSSPVTGDLLSMRHVPALEVLWIPTSASLSLTVEKSLPKPRKYDPALLLEYAGNRYLVAFWDIMDEDPSEHILREFTVGKAKFPKKTV